MANVFIIALVIVALLLLSRLFAPKRRDPRLDRDWAGSEGRYDQGGPFPTRLPHLHDIDDGRPRY